MREAYDMDTSDMLRVDSKSLLPKGDGPPVVTALNAGKTIADKLVNTSNGE
jgi:hypothetical protein